MKNIYLILGDSGAGKSRTNRALTGILRGGYCNIRFKTGSDVDFCSWMRAAQEIPLQPDEIADEIHDKEESNFLVPLRIESVTRNEGFFPEGATYVDLFLSKKYNIVAIIVLGRDITDMPFSLPVNIPTSFIPTSRDMPSNAIAAQIRDAFGWQ